MVLRASSLAAVTILVCSMRLKPSSRAHVRTTCRTATMSWEERTGRVSSTGIAVTVAVAARERRAEQRHAFVHVETGTHTGERQTELDQRDGDGGPHADDNRLGVEHARHGGDVADH